MRTLTMAVVLVGLTLVSGCDRENLTAPVSDLAQTGNASCHPVKFTTVLTPLSEIEFTGVVTGDITGTVHQLFDEFHGFTGVTNVVAGDATWEITGGTVDELIGQTFVTRLTNRNVLLPGTSLVKNVGSLRALSGVELANLTYVGQTPLTTLETTLDFVGVICPE